MTAGRKAALLIGSAAVVLIIIAAIIAVLSFDINSYRSTIETAASKMTGMDVKINGRMGLSFFPFGLSARNIHVTDRAGEILSLERLKLRVELMPLLKRQLKVTACELIKPALTIVNDEEGKDSLERIRKLLKEISGTAFTLRELKLSRGALVYLDKKTGEKTELKEVNLVIKDMGVGDASGDAVIAVSFTGTMDCREVLQHNVQMANLKASIKAVKGVYHLQPVAIGSLVYFDKRAGEKTELKEINLALVDMKVADMSGSAIKNLSFTGSMECKELRKKNLRVDSIRSGIKAEKGVLSLNPLTMNIFGAKGEGEVVADKSEVDAVYKINLSVAKLDFERLQESFGVAKLISGKGDLTTSLTVREKGGRSLLKGVNGTLSLRGDNLVTNTIDLDKVLSSYETSQKFNLVDIGAFLIAGPLGSAALKGYRYGDVVYETMGGRGTITHFVSHWKIGNGMAEATDCALATRHNRVAIKGRLNLVRGRYDNVTAALLDDKGCAVFKQTITGPFESPGVGAVSVVQSLVGPILNIYRQAERFVRGGKCEVFYRGAVKQPR